MQSPSQQRGVTPQERIVSDVNITEKQQEYLNKVRKAGMTAVADPGKDVADTGPRFDPAPLFEPLRMGALDLPNRIVMAPMTRNMSPGGVPGANVAAYYRRRAEGGIGLIVTEGTYIPQSGAGFSPAVPRFYGADALAGWKHVVDEVHEAGAKIFPQLWHVGLMPLPGDELDETRIVSPSAIVRPSETMGAPASSDTIEETIRAFGDAAASAQAIGCDGIQIHGAHGYLVDQFFWDATNRRDDAFGGADLLARSRFALDIVRECRAQTSPDFPISFRFSQWKQQDFAARLAASPAELEAFLLPLVDAGVDIFDCSTRRFWEPEFERSDMNLAGWTRKITGKVTSTVGSITLNTDLFSSFATETRTINNMNRLIEMMARGDFDLVSIGRSAIVDATWANKVREGSLHTLTPYSVAALGTLD
jgi:2,4-dienoyl-CoA reductase-like NADH-dependent reductase (Old Yellow Enzyme family)